MLVNTTHLTPKQREAIYEAWIAALRSGQYKQGRNYLELDGKFDSLGVLCHVLHTRPELRIEMDRIVIFDEAAVYLTPTSPRCHQSRVKVPDSIADELGLSTTMPSAVHRAVEDVLIDLNDVDGASFAEIAQFIEDAVMPLLRTEGILLPAQQEAPEGAITPKKERETHENTSKAMTDAPLMMEEREKRDEALLRQALETLKAENEMLREALKEADNELDWLDESIDPCDHSYWDTRRKVKAALAKESSND